jgi:hypothetical protein
MLKNLGNNRGATVQQFDVKMMSGLILAEE